MRRRRIRRGRSSYNHRTRLESDNSGMDDAENAGQIDREAFSVTSLSEQSDNRSYWQSRSPEERLAAIEQLRQLNYDYDPAADRLQSVLEVARRA